MQGPFIHHYIVRRRYLQSHKSVLQQEACIQFIRCRDHCATLQCPWTMVILVFSLFSRGYDFLIPMTYQCYLEHKNEYQNDSKHPVLFTLTESRTSFVLPYLSIWQFGCTVVRHPVISLLLNIISWNPYPLEFKTKP